MLEGTKDLGGGVYVGSCRMRKIDSCGMHSRHASSLSAMPLVSEVEGAESGVCVRAAGSVYIMRGGVLKTSARGSGARSCIGCATTTQVRRAEYA